MHSDFPVIRLTDPRSPGMLAYFDLWTESLNGDRVLYFRFDGPIPGPGTVMVCQRDGRGARELGRSDIGNPHTAARQLWIDADTVAFNRPGAKGPQSVLVSLKDGSSRVLEGAIRTYNEVLGLGAYSSHDFRNYGMTCPEEAVFVLDVRTGKSRKLFDREAALAVVPDRDRIFSIDEMNFKHTKWSPDGKRLFCVFNNEAAVKADPRPERQRQKWLIVADADGSNLRCLCACGGHPMWMPDSRAVFMYKGTCIAHPLDGGQPRLIHRGPGVHGNISPDGRRVLTDAFDYPQPGRAAVLCYDMGGEAPTVLAVLDQGALSRQSQCHPHPVWSRDGRRVYFNSMDDGIPQLHAVEL